MRNHNESKIHVPGRKTGYITPGGYRRLQDELARLEIVAIRYDDLS
jgi:hypothetical protein